MPEGDGSGDTQAVNAFLQKNSRWQELGDSVVCARHVQKAYEINDGKEVVVALRDLNLVDGGEFYPVKKFVCRLHMLSPPRSTD